MALAATESIPLALFYLSILICQIDVRSALPVLLFRQFQGVFAEVRQEFISGSLPHA